MTCSLGNNQAITDILLAARLLRPYYARALGALTPVEVPGMGTIGVDEHWRLLYDPVWLAALPVRQQAALIACHEVEHLIRRHAKRRGPRDPMTWNVAADAEINDDVEPGDLPANGITPKSLGCPNGLTAEEYYEPTCSLTVRCGSGSGGLRLPGEQEGSEDCGLDPAAQERVIAATAADVRAAAARDRGSVPANVQIWADAEAAPVVIPWPRLLASSLRRARGLCPMRGREDYSWAKMSRRTRPGGILRPGLIKYRVSATIIVDTSGSMAGDGGDVLGVVRSIAARSDIEVRETIECDAAIASRARGAKRRGLGKGGGGTDMRPALAAVKTPMSIVVTDGESPWPESAPSHAVVVVLVGKSPSPPPAWAQTVEVGHV